MTPESVLLLTPRWARDGGVGAHVLASAGALASAGVKVGVLVARAQEQPPAGISLFESASLFDTGRPIEERLRACSEFSPDAVHLHQVDDPDLVQALRKRAPVLVSAHAYTACTSGVHYFGPGEECSRAHGPGCVPNLLVRGCAHTRRPQRLPAAYSRAGLGLRALERADLAISYSGAVDRHLAANGLERRATVPLFSTMVPREGSGHETRRRVVFAGRVVAPKGVAVLIRAARNVEAEFAICGSGWRVDAMRRLARRLRVDERVQFKGWMDGPALAQELADASIVAIPSLWPEPFGLVGIEALASGRPVVASSTGGICDWLQDGHNGLAVAPGDVGALARALQGLLDDPARQQSMGLAGREMVTRRFSAERHVQALLGAYSSARAHWLAEMR
jgi:glycosyltransferase involved in cell wall biosynthesis